MLRRRPTWLCWSSNHHSSRSIHKNRSCTAPMAPQHLSALPLTRRLPAFDFRVTGHLVTLPAFQRQTSATGIIQTVTCSHEKAHHGRFPAPPSWTLKFPLKIGQLSLLRTVFMPEKNLPESLTHHISAFQQCFVTGTPASMWQPLIAP